MPVTRLNTPTRLRLNEDVLRECYGLFDATEPFCHWGMPNKHDVVFKIMRKKDTSGDHSFDKVKKVHTIRISSRCVGTFHRLGIIMGHEMIHVAEVVLGTVSRGAMHNKAFMKMSDEVCSCHGFDRLDFAEIE